MRTKSRAGKSAKKSNFKVICIGIILLLVVVSIGVGVKLNNTVNEWKDLVYPGITINGIDVSHKTKDEVKNVLVENFQNKINDKKLVLKSNNVLENINYKDLDPKYNIDETVDEALNFGKANNLFSKSELIKNGANKAFTIEFNYNEDSTKKVKEAFKKKVNKEPKNAKITINGGAVNISDDSNGYKVKDEEMDKIVKANINGNVDELNTEVDIPVETVEPRLKKAELSKISAKLSSFESDFSNRSQPGGRDKNLIAATRYVNGTVVLPGETFSFNDTVGERTIERGFGMGGIFVNNKVESGLGGGICEVSTTLYRAIMGSGIRSVERTNHSMLTSYAKPGLDATVAMGSLDYKFKNTYDFPIYIEGSTDNKKVVFNVYGANGGLGGKSYDLVSNISDGGYKAEAFLVTYQNNSEVKREHISSDVYNRG